MCRALVLVNSHLAAHKDTGLGGFSLHFFLAEASFLVCVKGLTFLFLYTVVLIAGFIMNKFKRENLYNIKVSEPVIPQFLWDF